MNNLMVDLETLSTKHNAVILQIGACPFNEEEIGKEIFEINISIDSCLKNNLKIDEDTLTWWIQQEKRIQRLVFTRGEELSFALRAFNTFINEQFENDNFLIWSNGGNFDIPILENAYNQVELKWPWKYFNIRCYRTLVHTCLLPNNLVDKIESCKERFDSFSHTASADATYQAEVASIYLKHLKGKLDEST